MRLPLHLRSRDEQRAVFSRLSYREFCDKANKDMWKKLANNSSVKGVSFREFNRQCDKEFNAGYPATMKDRLLTDKTMDMKHTYFGGDVPYDQFWFETERTNFSMNPRWVDDLVYHNDMQPIEQEDVVSTVVFSGSENGGLQSLVKYIEEFGK